MSRNSRRAYDKDGREILPAMMANIKALGCHTVEASSQKCGHRRSSITDAPDVALRLRCSTCGSRDIRSAINMAEYYATLRASTGWQPLCRL
jgi:hypothetical protein